MSGENSNACAGTAKMLIYLNNSMDNQEKTLLRQRGRPKKPQPIGRDLAAERIHLKGWLEKYPIYKPGTISVAANMYRACLTHLLSGYRAPQAKILDAVYDVLKPYGYIPQKIDNTNDAIDGL
jgi:hypothetical protein